MSATAQKACAARAAAEHVATHLPQGAILGVGTGSTANLFIDALAPLKDRLGGAVASSEATRQRLLAIGIPVIDLNEAGELALYVDGADEIDAHRHMTKGGGGALTREKIVAEAAQTFLCIVDASKEVGTLGGFPLPVEIIPMAEALIARKLAALGGKPTRREGFVTDNGNLILDVAGLTITDPVALEAAIERLPGVVCCGLFARRGADLVFIGTDQGLRVLP
ncbi:MAG: ribose-5-phosphate isomerase RpiA [Zoogloeaceae bacterium]|jgi:ribose 5-phosphate isomerase A|nr:ribose-5-phosphate isomerase RpiA [Zoogloeaceae bacterium]